MPSTKSLQNFAKTSLQKSPICYSFIINRGNKPVEKPLLGKTSSRRFVKSFMTCMNQMTDEQRTVFTRHELFPAIAWTKRLNQCSVEGICVMIEVLSLFTVSPLLLSAITQCMRTVSHKSLLHKLSSSFRTSITNQNNLKSILTFLCEERTRPCDFALSLPYWPATGYSCQNVFLSSVLALVIGGWCALIQAPLRSSL